KRCAYCPRPSVLSQSATCCMAAPAVSLRPKRTLETTETYIPFLCGWHVRSLGRLLAPRYSRVGSTRPTDTAKLQPATRPRQREQGSPRGQPVIQFGAPTVAPRKCGFTALNQRSAMPLLRLQRATRFGHRRLKVGPSASL